MNIEETWKAYFGSLAPVGHVMRVAIPQRWLRIHSLPDAKRYAEANSEYAELLQRHNEVAQEILGVNDDALLYLHAWGANEDFLAAFSEFSWTNDIGFSSADLTSIPAVSDEESRLVMGGFVIRWSAHAWNMILRDVADGNVGSIVLCNPRTGEVYAPYDGGADVFVADSARVQLLKRRWSSWLSMRPDGL